MEGSRGQHHRAGTSRRLAVAALFAAAVFVAAVALTGCDSPSILRAEGSAARDPEARHVIFAILSGVLLTVWVILIYVIVRFRKRPESEASQTKGNLRIEIVWTPIPAVIVTVLFALT